MLIPLDPVLCFYLLLGQRYFVDNNPNFHKPQAWFSKTELITNENIFDLNDVIPKVIVNDSK